MPLFYYKSVDTLGKRYSGMIDASSAKEASDKLRRQQLVVVALESQKKKSSLLFSTGKNESLTGQDLIAFTTQLAQLLKAGLPLYESLLTLEEQYREEKFHRVLLTLCDAIKTGTALSASMRQFPESFPPLYSAMVVAGESVGMLDAALEGLAQLLTKQMKLKKQLLTALIYPLILACFSLVVITLLLTFVIPSLETLFEDQRINSLTSAVISASHFLRSGWPIYLPFLAAVVCGGFAFWRTGKGRTRISGWFLKVPILKTIIIESAMCRFLRTLGTLLGGGVSIIEALSIGREVMKNRHLEAVVAAAEKRIVEGSVLSIELKKSPLIPPLVPRMLAIGEEGGKVAMMANKMADLYEEEVDKTLNRLLAVLQPALLLCMGVVIAIIMLAVLLPLTDINAFIQN